MLPELARRARPLLQRLDPELAHRLTIQALKRGWVEAEDAEPDDPILRTRLFGHEFANPVGLAPGFDKNAEVPVPMLGFGFGFVEVGTVTPRPQEGNPRPRIFRLRADKAVINRLGFNNAGLAAVKPRIEALRRDPDHRSAILGVNIGANRDSHDRAMDYETCLRAFDGLAHYFAINVSSPNTPGLRGLQGRTELGELLERLVKTRAELTPENLRPTPLLLKIAPDLEPGELEDVAEVVQAHKLEGLIISNTTVGEREGLKSANRVQAGGLSGVPLFKRSTAMLADVYRMTGGRAPLIGVGGIASGRDAYLKILMGASLVELYTALIYQGPELVGQIKRDLANYLKADGFPSVMDAVGVGADGTHRSVLKALSKT